MSDHSKYPKSAGIYKLTCIHNDKVYIGKAVNIHKRLGEHRVCKRRGYLQNAVLKHGWDSFNVEVIEIIENFDKLTDNVYLLEREAYYIELYDSTNVDKGYNLCKFSRDKTGLPHSEETKEKMRNAALGRKVSEETKEKLRQFNLGKKRILSDEEREWRRQNMLGNTFALGYVHTDEAKEKMGGPLSEEHVAKIRKANTGKRRSEESRKNISQGKLGKTFSEEHKKNLSKAFKGRKLSDETKEKMRQYRLGKPRSEETKEKMRQTIRRKKLERLEKKDQLNTEI